MLRIHTVTSASDAKHYYSASDYYADGQETVGRWAGELAERLGLSGAVDRRSFERLCDNLHPATGERLTARTNAERRVGYDFVFSAPKSFSVVEALAEEGDRRALLRAFRDSVRETLAEIEPDLQTRVRRGGAFDHRTTGNLVAATFEHSTARPVEGAPPDPHRHIHALVFNATFDPVERRIKAGEFGAIKRDGEYYTAAFYARLARKLEAMGYGIDRRGGKAWEIAGVPRSVIERFSKRTVEVEDEHRDRLANDPGYRPESKHELGAMTRSKKPEALTPGELRQAWEAQLTEGEREALAVVHRREVASGKEVTAEEAVAFANRHCFERESVVPERALKAVALLQGLGHVTAEQIDREMPRQGVLVREHQGRRLASTRALQREEGFLVTLASQGRGKVVPVGVPGGLERGRLDDDQWGAVRGLLGSSDRVNIVDSAAGTGKSTMLAAFDRGMKLAGEKVTYLATTAPAVKVLEKDGFAVATVARFLLDERLQDAATGGRVVVDEASLLGHRDAYRLFTLAREKDLSLIFVGDSMQHGPVPRGALLRVLQQYGGIKPFRLTAIKRQQEKGYLEAVKALAKGDPVAGFDRLDAKGWVRQLTDEERDRQIAKDYLQALDDRKTVLVVSPTHAEAGHITDAIRAALRRAGRIEGEERTFARLVAADASEAERGLAGTYRPGDVLQFHQNAKGFKKGERLIVADPAMVPVSEAARFQLYRPEPIALAKGDVLRFTATVATLDGNHKLKNGSVHAVAGFTSNGIRLDNGWLVPADAGHFRSGFVETSFGSQGRTVQRVLLGMSSRSKPAMNAEQMYVSSSRARETLTLYTDDKGAVREAIRHSSAKLAALDLARQRPKSGRRDWLHRHLARMRRLAHIGRLRAAWTISERQVGHGR